MTSQFKPGQTVKCTVLKLPRAAADRKTIERLMRRDPAVVRGLRKSYRLRARSTVVYNRGNRDWVQRQKVGKIVRLVPGNTWTFPYDLGATHDLAAVVDFVKIEAA